MILYCQYDTVVEIIILSILLEGIQVRLTFLSSQPRSDALVMHLPGPCHVTAWAVFEQKLLRETRLLWPQKPILCGNFCLQCEITHVKHNFAAEEWCVDLKSTTAMTGVPTDNVSFEASSYSMTLKIMLGPLALVMLSGQKAISFVGHKMYLKGAHREKYHYRYTLYPKGV